MSKKQRMLVIVSLGLAFAVGFIVGVNIQGVQPVAAQDYGNWRLHTGLFGDNEFYAVKFNPTTGESMFLAGDVRLENKWLILPVEDKRKK